MQVMTALILKSILWGNQFNNKMCGLIFQETQFGMEKNTTGVSVWSTIKQTRALLIRPRHTNLKIRRQPSVSHRSQGDNVYSPTGWQVFAGDSFVMTFTAKP